MSYHLPYHGLPAEIREQIYAEVLCPASGVVATFEIIYDDEIPEIEIDWKLRHHPPVDTTLFLTNHEVHDEAVAVFFARNTFHLEAMYANEAIDYLVDHLPRSVLNRIQRLAVTADACRSSDLPTLMELICRETSVKELTVFGNFNLIYGAEDFQELNRLRTDSTLLQTVHFRWSLPWALHSVSSPLDNFTWTPSCESLARCFIDESALMFARMMPPTYAIWRKFKVVDGTPHDYLVLTFKRTAKASAERDESIKELNSWLRPMLKFPWPDPNTADQEMDSE